MYVEHHCRSAFSFLEGASIPEELAGVCAQLGMTAMSMLDVDGVYGAPRFHLAAKKLGLQAHIGVEVTTTFHVSRFKFQETSCQWPVGSEQQSSKGERQSKTHILKLNSETKDAGVVRVPVLAASRRGYQNLCRLITRMKARGPKHCNPAQTAATTDDLRQFASGLICLTGDDNGPLAWALRIGGLDAGRTMVAQLAEIFGRENVYVELQRHFLADEEARNHAAVQIANESALPLLATNGVCYATPAEREVADVLTCIREHTTIDEAGRLLARNSEHYLKSPEQMERLFADLPQAIANTVELSSRLEFTLNDLGYEFPKYPVPDGHTMNSFLRELTDKGAQERYGQATPELRARARRQIERELALIEKLDLAGYFIIVWDIVRFCREQKILVQGRGSAANSAVCYSLEITAVDPVKMDLLFERFLSEERGEWPDIDLDLPSGDQRERAIQYVYQRYGRLGAAMTANVITYRGKLAAREIGKALGFDGETLDRLAALVGGWEYRDPKDTLERQFHDAGVDLRHPRIRKFLDLCLAVQNLPRHLGQHSGGMVICQGQLDSVVPLEPASMPGRVVVQWDKEDCADMGIIKVDLLGLGMMAVLEDSLALIREHYGENVDLAQLPPADRAVFAALQKADTVGMFQVESRAQMSCLPRLYPVKFYDIVVQVALIRPGPIVGAMVNPYIKRRQGKETVTYPHPSLEPILERTLGVPLFQEQLLRIAMVAAGFTGGEAEELRRAFGFKRSERRMQEIEVKLRAGMQRNGIVGEAQEQIIHAITSFALYGFPESHAASFALIAYASAYLKCHYLAAFIAALLNNWPMGFYHPSTIVKDAQRHGLKMKPIDVMRSDWKCTLERAESDGKDFAVRLGLRYVRGLREGAARALVRERNRQPFTSIADLAQRVPELRKSELVTLADIGALNIVGSQQATIAAGANSRANDKRSKQNETRNLQRETTMLKLHRRDALWQVERAARHAGPLLHQVPQADAASPLQPMDVDERLVADFRGTGLTVGPHPLAYRRQQLDRQNILSAAELPKLPNGRHVRTAGCVIARQRPGTAHGFVFLSLEDETGISNAIITPDLFDQNRLLLVREKFLVVEGKLQNIDNVVSVKVEQLQALSLQELEITSHDFH